MRDDFDEKTKEILAKRVGNRCSNPNCRQLTSGPQTDPSKAINVGVAAHITAASPGGPRYDPKMTMEERKSPENGIWLCQNCAKLVDNDEGRYNSDLLKSWKKSAEETALQEIETRNVMSQPSKKATLATPEKERLSPYQSSDILFSGRLADTFPGLSGTEEFQGENAIKRLEILLREPLKTEGWADETSISEGDSPFWWLRGFSTMPIEEFQRLGTDRVLVFPHEIRIGRIVAVRVFDLPERDFVYVEALPEDPIGLYAYAEGEIQAKLQKSLERGHGYYVSEEYAVWESKPISRAEYDDGSTIVDGSPVRTKGARLRIRHLTPYNFVLCGNMHVLNQSEYDKETTQLFDNILLGRATTEDLINYVGELPRPMRFDPWR